MSFYTAWSYEGTFLNISRVHNYTVGSPALSGADGHVMWTSGVTHKTATYVSSGGAAPSSGGGDALLSAQVGPRLPSRTVSDPRGANGSLLSLPHCPFSSLSPRRLTHTGAC